MRFALTVTLMGLFFSAPCRCVAQTKGEDLSQVRCGLFCLYVATSILSDEDMEFDKLDKLLGAPDPQGYSLEQLKSAAEQSGFHAAAVQTTCQRLGWRRAMGESFACIAHLKRGHFVLVRDVAGEIVQLADPPKVFDQPVSVFESIWSGNVLLISKNPLTPEEDLVDPGRGWQWKMAFLGIVLGVAGVSLLAWRWFPRSGKS